jgi:hypothetical protein
MYEPPSPGTPVVLVSDLGRTRPPFGGNAVADPAEWELFIRVVRHNGCPAVCLTPYAAGAYARRLRADVAFIPLDRRISLRHAREATRRIRRPLGRP